MTHRKLTLTYIAMTLIVLGYFSAGHWASLKDVYSEFCMAIIACSTIYTGGNAAVKWMYAKKPPKIPEVPPEQV